MATNAHDAPMTYDSAVDAGASRGGRFAVGLLCGAAVGATLGLLLAPKSGQDTRRQIADTAQRARQRANDAYAQAHQAVDGAVSGSRRALEAGAKAFKDAQRANRPERATGVAIS